MNLKIILTAFLIVIGVFYLFSYSQEPQYNPEVCNIYQETDKDNINLMFFGEKDDVEEEVDNLFAIVPFSEYKDKFNIYYIEEYPNTCELIENHNAVNCYDRSLKSLSDKCPHDYRVYIFKQVGIRSTAIPNKDFISLNNYGSKNTLPHEMAHLVSYLQDEYVEVGSEPEVFNLNCRKECNWEVSDGCFKGCGSDDYYRSVDRGLMRGLNSNYFGKYNEKVLRESLDRELSEKTPITAQIIDNIVEKEVIFVD